MSLRTQRVAKLIHRDIAEILAREFPDIISMVTVTGTRVTRDLSIVYVDLSIMLDSVEERQKIFDDLVGKSPTIRKMLAQRIRHQVHVVPTIRFFLDNSQEHLKRMDSLFEQIENSRKLAGI